MSCDQNLIFLTKQTFKQVMFGGVEFIILIGFSIAKYKNIKNTNMEKLNKVYVENISLL